MGESLDFELVQNCFSDNWQLYQQIVQFNYLEHQEIYNVLKQYVVKNYPHPFSLLELGCGDASCSTKAMSGTAIQTYTGVDLSLAGLEFAAQNLNRLNCSGELKQQEMLEFLEGCPATFDLILTSFALHHLSAAQKQVFLQQCWHHLSPGGVLFLIDVFCRNQESRPEYLARYCDYLQTQWQKLPPQSIAVATEHIRSSDFPESEATLRIWAREIGFQQVELIYTGTQEAHKAFALSKGSMKYKVGAQGLAPLLEDW